MEDGAKTVRDRLRAALPGAMRAHGDVPSLQSLGSGAVSGGVGGALDGTTKTPDGADIRANVDNPYSRSWNSGDAQDIPSDDPNNVNTDDEDYPATDHPGPAHRLHPQARPAGAGTGSLTS